jgi:hypothetical protein
LWSASVPVDTAIAIVSTITSAVCGDGALWSASVPVDTAIAIVSTITSAVCGASDVGGALLLSVLDPPAPAISIVSSVAKRTEEKESMSTW